MAHILMLKHYTVQQRVHTVLQHMLKLDNFTSNMKSTRGGMGVQTSKRRSRSNCRVQQGVAKWFV